MNATNRPQPSEPEIQRALAETSAAGREKKKPDWSTVCREFGNIPADEGLFTFAFDEEGEPSATLKDFTHDKKWLKKFHAMTEEHRGEDYAVGQQMVADTFSRREKLRNRITGEIEIIPEGFESPTFKKKFTTLRKAWNRWTTPKEEAVERRDPPRIYAAHQWYEDCPTCGYKTDRWERDVVFGTKRRLADVCSRCLLSIRSVPA